MPTALTLEAAGAIVAAAMEAAAATGASISVAVVDAGGALAFGRGDQAAPFTATVAIDKAWTAAVSGIPTHVWNGYVADPAVAPLTGLPRMLAVTGGFPLPAERTILGGVGVSGGTCDQDQEIAAQAMAAVGEGTTDMAHADRS